MPAAAGAVGEFKRVSRYLARRAGEGRTTSRSPTGRYPRELMARQRNIATSAMTATAVERVADALSWSRCNRHVTELQKPLLDFGQTDDPHDLVVEEVHDAFRGASGRKFLSRLAAKRI